jgi:hypothetical protein
LGQLLVVVVVLGVEPLVLDVVVELVLGVEPLVLDVVVELVLVVVFVNLAPIGFHENQE